MLAKTENRGKKKNLSSPSHVSLLFELAEVFERRRVSPFLPNLPQPSSPHHLSLYYFTVTRTKQVSVCRTSAQMPE